MDVVAKIIPLKPKSSRRVREWAETLNSRRDEALETLRDEGVEIESWFQFTLDGKDYLIGYMRAESIAIASDVVKTSEHPIDAYHQQFKQDTWDRGNMIDAELMVDLVDA